MITKRSIYHLLIVLLLCFIQSAGIVIYGQNRPRAALKRAHILQTDSLKTAQHPQADLADSLNPKIATPRPEVQTEARTDSIAVADSIANANRRQMIELTSSPDLKEPKTSTDSLSKEIKRKTWIPDPTRATWMALIIPGGGQIYNRKYWKLPIFYGGFAGCAYALTWNGKMYRDYFDAYRDAANGNWTSTSITDLIPPSYMNQVSKDRLVDLLRRRKDTFRRYRDLSIFAFIAVYLLSVVDAYVDAELSNFDISPDLSMKVEPAVIDTRTTFHQNNKSVGLQCSFKF